MENRIIKITAIPVATHQAAPTIGDNVYMRPGAKIFGGIVIGSNCAIDANGVVNKSFPEESVTLVGIPARGVSHDGSKRFIKFQTDDL